MNIIDPSINSALNNATNMTLLNDPTKPFDLPRLTELLASVVSSSGGATYSLGLFFGLAAALTAGSCVLPLITGPIFRLTLQSVDRNRKYWRLIYPTLLSLYVLAIYIVFPILTSQFGVDYLRIVAFAFQLLLPATAFLSIFQDEDHSDGSKGEVANGAFEAL